METACVIFLGEGHGIGGGLWIVGVLSVGGGPISTTMTSRISRAGLDKSE